MKISDYIVEFLIKKQIKDVFGYPGGMVTHLMDSFSRYENQIKAHVCYHEQAASFEACSYAQVSNDVGVAYATSGPGATNMITGICNAYFDSIPVIFITGQVNTFESKNEYEIRQRGFQETNIVDMVRDVTKYAVYVNDAYKVGYYLEKAYSIATSGRKGPVLLDIPMNIQREDIELDDMETYKHIDKSKYDTDFSRITDVLENAKRPCIILGAALKGIPKKIVEEFICNMKFPVVTSMVAMDLLTESNIYNYGFIGAYGSRIANFVVAKSDCILVLGSRMDVRQAGGKRTNFAPEAKIIRVDIDRAELEYHIREDEIDINANVLDVMEYLNNHNTNYMYSEWINICDVIKEKLSDMDNRRYNEFVKRLSDCIPSNTIITTDVGQNQVWVAQSFKVKDGQQILYSGGHGAMGYSLPAAIGAYYASGNPVVSFNGDGGIQMNIQELEFIRRDNLPIKVIVFNNYALGMIRHFQEMYFNNNYSQTVSGKGYETPNFEKIAHAYDMKYISYDKVEEVSDEFMQQECPVLVEIKLPEDTYVFPKLEFGKPNQDQEPLIDRELFNQLMEL